MAEQALVLKEVIALLQAISAPKRVIEEFRNHAERVMALRNEQGCDNVTVSSGLGSDTRKGTVQLTLNDQRTQMDAAKAREIGLMLLEAAESATSDEMFMTLLTERIGIEYTRAGQILVDLREIRQGTRGIRWQTGQ